MTTAKIFKNGRSQAVRLPAAFRFDAKEVYIRRDANTGDVILSKRPGDWDEFFRNLQASEEERADFANFLIDRGNNPPRERELFE